MRGVLCFVILVFIVNSCTVPVEVEIDHGVRNAEKVPELINDHRPDRTEVYIDDSLLINRVIFEVEGSYGLKSKGLELIQNDSLRLEIISLYEYDYTALQKLEETYGEMQFHNNYYKELNRIISPYFDFDQSGSIKKIILQ